MSFDVNWDIDKYKEDNESGEQWMLRRNFMERWKSRYPEDRLVCLARVFANIEFMGCRYPNEVMQEVAQMSKEVNKHVTYRNLSFAGKTVSHRSFGDGSTWNKYSKADFEAKDYFDDDEESVGLIIDESVENADKFANNDCLKRRNPMEAMQESIVCSDGGIRHNTDFWSDNPREDMQVPRSISNELQSTYSDNNAYEPSIKKFGGDTNTASQYNMQERSLSNVTDRTYSQGFVPENTDISDSWQYRDPRRYTQNPTIKLSEGNEIVRQLPYEQSNERYDLYSPNSHFSQEAVGINTCNSNVDTHKFNQPPQTTCMQAGGLENCDSQNQSGSTFSHNSIKAYSDSFQNNDIFPLFEDRTPNQTNNPVLGYNPNDKMSKPCHIDTTSFQVVCDNTPEKIDFAESTEKNHSDGNMLPKIELAQSSEQKEERSKPKKKKLLGQRGKRYKYWLMAGKSEEEAMELCEKRLSQVPEYKVLRKKLGTVSLIKNLSNMAFELKAGNNPANENWPLDLCRTRKQKFMYWIQNGKSVLEAKLLSGGVKKPGSKNKPSVNNKYVKVNQNKVKNKTNKSGAYVPNINQQSGELRFKNRVWYKGQSNNPAEQSSSIENRFSYKDSSFTQNKIQNNPTTADANLLTTRNSVKIENASNSRYSNPTTTHNANKPSYTNNESWTERKSEIAYSYNTTLTAEEKREKRKRKKARQIARKYGLNTQDGTSGDSTLSNNANPNFANFNARNQMSANATSSNNATRPKFANPSSSSHSNNQKFGNATSVKYASKPNSSNYSTSYANNPNFESYSTSQYSGKQMYRNSGASNQNNFLKVCIKDTNIPIKQKEYAAFNKFLPQCIGGEEIRILNCENRSGCIIMTCADEYSRDWMDKEIPSFTPWNGAQLTVVDDY